MRKKRAVWTLRILVTLCGAFGWWGMLYPELTMTPDTYRIVAEEYGFSEEMPEDPENGEIYEILLQADRGKVRFRSKLFLNLSTFWKQYISEERIWDQGEDKL